VEASGSGLEPALTVKPNPSASAFVLEVASDGARPVDVRIYSVSGLLVKTLCPEGTSAGALSLVWRGDSDDGSRVSPGTYFAVVKVGERTSVRKLVLQR